MVAVAKGQIDAFMFYGLLSWDQAAAAEIIKQAGGMVTAADGGPWNAFEPNIVASNGHIHQQLLELLPKT